MRFGKELAILICALTATDISATIGARPGDCVLRELQQHG
jgi:hypothetical protein